MATHIEQSLKKAVASYLSAHEDEDTLTGHLGSALQIADQQVFVEGDEQRTGMWIWGIDYRKFRSHGKGAAEAVLGADGIFELQVRRQQSSETKSLLFQAKSEWSNDPNLLRQAVLLTTWREAAFVLNYRAAGFEAIPLDDVINSRGHKKQAKQVIPLGSYLTNHFIDCLVGDTELRYHATRHKLVWRAMNNEVVSTDFKVGKRFRIKIAAPGADGVSTSRYKQIKNSEIHEYRMKAEFEDILGVEPSATLKEKTKARNALALTYHPDRLRFHDELLDRIINRRVQENNEAFEYLKKRGW